MNWIILLVSHKKSRRFNVSKNTWYVKVAAPTELADGAG